jgi:hypothetical protein
MRFSTRALAMALALCLAPAAAHAQEAKGLGDWSVIGTQVNTGKPFQDVKIGWPSMDFGLYTMNIGTASDIGFRFALLWGNEYFPYAGFGLGAYAPIRFQLTKGQDRVNWLVHVDPGIMINFGSSYCGGTYYWYAVCGSSSTTFGIQAPVGVVGGYPVLPGLEIGGGGDVKLAIFFGSGTTDFVIAPMVGPYAEYQLKNPNISFGLNTRFGVAIHTASGMGTDFAWETQATVGYRLF